MKNEIKVGGNFTLEFIGNYNDLVENVITFNNCINDSDLLKSRLRQFRHWYYIEELDKFAPSKFIGYKGNSPEAYERGTDPVNGYMDGRDTERELRMLFSGRRYEGQVIHREKLIEFLNGFGTIPYVNVHIHVIQMRN